MSYMELEGAQMMENIQRLEEKISLSVSEIAVSRSFLNFLLNIINNVTVNTNQDKLNIASTILPGIVKGDSTIQFINNELTHLYNFTSDCINNKTEETRKHVATLKEMKKFFLSRYGNSPAGVNPTLSILGFGINKRKGKGKK
jgi:hypothetical protein